MRAKTTTRASMRYTSSFGYPDVMLLQDTHRILPPRTAPDFCRSSNTLALSAGEFGAAARDYPIVFLRGGAQSRVRPVAVLGLADAQNLYVDAEGNWEAGSYRPAVVRCYPFCTLTPLGPGKKSEEKWVGVASAAVSAGGLPLFDEAHSPMPYWQAAQQLLRDYDRDLQATAQMCIDLDKLKLFAPFSFKIVQSDQPRLTLGGMLRVDEERLRALKATQIKSALTRGWIGKIYAHLQSLENFARLYQRAAAASKP